MRIWISVIMGFMSCVVCGQEASSLDYKTTTLAVKAGYLNSRIYGADKSFLAVDSKVDSYNSFLVGLSVNNAFNNHWALKHELLYQNYGAKFNLKQDKNILKTTLQMHSLVLNPISLSYKIYGIELYVGPYLSLLLNSSITSLDSKGNRYKDYQIYGSGDNDQSVSDYLQKMDYGGVIGASYYITPRMNLGVQYSKGVASIFDNANSFENNNSKAKRIYNCSFSIFLSYIL